MSIWFKSFTLEEINQRGKNTLAEFLGIEFTSVDEDSLTATMPAEARTKQPMGIVHGGANVVLAETIASTGANLVVDIEKFYCVGLEINANHIRPVRGGLITGIARPLHLGRTTQVWHIDLFNEVGKPTCVSRMTASVVAR
jgi:1,4-dihydroxy-2-naphthoyl-CoA hydrolase